MKKAFTFLIMIVLISCVNKSDTTEQQSKMNSLENENDSLIHLQNQLRSKIDSLVKESDFWFRNNVDGRQLLKSGINNPEEYIINSLKQKPELIPLASVLGGQMKFSKIKLLGKGCLIAYYEDGHVGGKTIYSYSFTEGKLSFKIIKTCSD